MHQSRPALQMSSSVHVCKQQLLVLIMLMMVVSGKRGPLLEMTVELLKKMAAALEAKQYIQLVLLVISQEKLHN